MNLTVHTDAIIFGTGFISMIIGFILGRWERKDSYTKTYRFGYEVGKRVGELNAGE